MLGFIGVMYRVMLFIIRRDDIAVIMYFSMCDNYEKYNTDKGKALEALLCI